MIAGNIPGRTQTMAVAIYDAVQSGNTLLANLMVLIISALAIGNSLLGQTVCRARACFSTVPAATARRVPQTGRPRKQMEHGLALLELTIRKHLPAAGPSPGFDLDVSLE